MVLAARGLRENEDGRTHGRIAQEFLSVVQRQARRVWIQTFATAVLVTAAAVVTASLLR